MDSNNPTAMANDAGVEPHTHVLKLWVAVGEQLKKEQTVIWANAVDTLEHARKYLATSTEARHFVDTYMPRIVSILLEQQPTKIGQMERDCVETSVRWSLQIITDGIKAVAGESNTDVNMNMSRALITLAHIFSRKKIYYKRRRQWSNTPVGLPEVRKDMINTFQRNGGFGYLALYFKREGFDSDFRLVSPGMFSVLHAVFESTKPVPLTEDIDEDEELKRLESARANAKEIADLCLQHLIGMDQQQILSGMDRLRSTHKILYKIYVRVSEYNPPALFTYFDFWRNWALKLITSEPHQLKVAGWEYIISLVEESKWMSPPPRSYIVSGAGLQFIDGTYEIVPDKLLPSGYLKPDTEPIYQRTVPTDYQDDVVAGRVITLSLCTMTSQQKWWFLSQADEDQPGTDRDIDYYKHKSKRDQERLPSSTGWITCPAGAGPAPSLKPFGGLLVPQGDTKSDYEQQLMEWIVENHITQLAFGDSMHSDIIERSAALVKFLLAECNECSRRILVNKVDSNQLCHQIFLQSWKVCSSTTDLALLAAMRKFLVDVKPFISEENRRTLVSSTLKTATFRQLDLNDDSLDSLEIGSIFMNTDSLNEAVAFIASDSTDLAKLGHYIAKNTELNSIMIGGRLSRDEDRDHRTSEFVDGLQHNNSIQRLSMKACNISSWASNAILNAFAVRKEGHLDQFSLDQCDLRAGNSLVVVSTITKYTALETICLSNCHVGHDLLFDLLAAIRGHSHLKTLHLGGNSIGDSGCEMLAERLTDPQCNLATLDVCQNQIGIEGYHALANTLSENSKLETLNLAGNNDASTVWDSLTEKLCDASSINAIFLSNHILQVIDLVPTAPTRESHDVARYLFMNQATNKSHVAMRKILRHCSHFDMEPFFRVGLEDTA